MSETNNQYWNGTQHAVLRRENVSASWGSGDYSGTSIDVANRAFCIWYYAKQSLNASATEPHWGEMYRTMNDCAKSGWGSGVSDLQEALDHMATGGGRWTDENTRTYMGGTGNSYARGLVQNVPEGCANFLNAVDDKLPELETVMREYQTKCTVLAGLRLRETQSATEWAQIKTHIDTIKTSAERIRPLLWLVPATISAQVPSVGGSTAAARIEAFSGAATGRITQTISFLDTVGNIHDSLTVYVEATRAFQGDRRAGIAFAALSYAMTYVPVLGGFYGTIIQKIPGLINNWRSFMTAYHQRSLHPEVYLQARGERQPAWRCEICNSSGGYA